MFIVLEIVFQHSNFEIVVICIEMQWQIRKPFLSDRLYVIIKSLPEISACFSRKICFRAFLQQIRYTMFAELQS